MADEADGDDTRPVAGFFGKLPSTGDFVERGLPPAFRGLWDRWLTTHIVPRIRAGAGFPAGGLRFRLVSGGVSAAGVILPSHDSVGREFPLSLLVIADGGLVPEVVDRWCNAALAVFDPAADPDGLWQRLDAIDPPFVAEDAGQPSLWLWSSGHAPAEFIEGGPVLDHLLS